MKRTAIACSLLAVILVLVASGIAVTSAAAQSWNETSCNVKPRATDELLSLMFDAAGSPIAALSSASGSLEGGASLRGEPVHIDTIDAVTQVVHQWLHCLANGEEGRALALMSDRYAAEFMASLYAEVLDSRDQLRTALDSNSRATPIAELILEFETAGRSIVRLADSRIAGIWSVAGDEAIVVLIQQNGSWLIDEVVTILDPATPAS